MYVIRPINFVVFTLLKQVAMFAQLMSGASHGEACSAANNRIFMMTSSNGNIISVTGPLWWESTGSPHKGQWRGALMFSLICAWTNDWGNNRGAGNLRRHCAHYDVTIIQHVAGGFAWSLNNKLKKPFWICSSVFWADAGFDAFFDVSPNKLFYKQLG